MAVEWFTEHCIYPMKWMGVMVMVCWGMTAKSLEMVAKSVRKLKAVIMRMDFLHKNNEADDTDTVWSW
jgi:hypothetical protein